MTHHPQQWIIEFFTYDGLGGVFYAGGGTTTREAVRAQRYDEEFSARTVARQLETAPSGVWMPVHARVFDEASCLRQRQGEG